MTFAEAIRTCWGKYASFSGRARRSEFWWWILFTFLVSVGTSIVDSVIFPGSVTGQDGYGPITSLANLVLLLPTLAVGARRLHDIDKSGWWQLISLVPLVGIILMVVWTVREGQSHPNRFGFSPRTIQPPPSPQDYVPPRR